MPTVSILLTCFNHIRYLPDAVAGIKSQTFTDYEIIAIDDGSTDGSREWLTANLSEAQLIFNEKNLGTYASLNVALAAATGDYIAILNDDDLWAPEKLQKQLDLFGTHPEVGLVHTDGHFVDGEGQRMQGSPLGFEFPRTETGHILTSLLYQNKIIASAVLVKRECFDKVGVFNPEYFGSGDWEMWLRIAEHYQIGFVAEPLTFYRVHGENASHKLERIWKDDEKLREWIRTKYADYAYGGFEAYNLKRAMAHNEACLGTVKVLNGKTEEGREAYRNSIKLEPTRFKSHLRLWATYLPASVFRKLK
jgi:glycosyltransferase involved in cell wall biosynthesis